MPNRGEQTHSELRRFRFSRAYENNYPSAIATSWSTSLGLCWWPLTGLQSIHYAGCGRAGVVLITRNDNNNMLNSVPLGTMHVTQSGPVEIFRNNGQKEQLCFQGSTWIMSNGHWDETLRSMDYLLWLKTLHFKTSGTTKELYLIRLCDVQSFQLETKSSSFFRISLMRFWLHCGLLNPLAYLSFLFVWTFGIFLLFLKKHLNTLFNSVFFITKY